MALKLVRETDLLKNFLGYKTRSITNTALLESINEDQSKSTLLESLKPFKNEIYSTAKNINNIFASENFNFKKEIQSHGRFEDLANTFLNGNSFLLVL